MEAVILALIVVGAVAYTLATLVLGFRTRWWRTPAGRALMISTPAVAILLLTELVFAFSPVSYHVELIVSVATLALITVGGCLKLGAIVYELRRGRPPVPPAGE